MRNTIFQEIYKLAARDKRVVFVGSDLGAGVLSDFKRDFPKRFFMEGVSEGHIMSMVAGMAFEGKIVYVCTITPFFTRRTLEQIIVDVAMHQLPVRIIGIGAGLVYAPLGPTHMAIEDIAVMRSIPHMTVVAVSDTIQMTKLIPQTLRYPGPIYIRLAKGGDKIVTDKEAVFKIGKAMEYAHGKDGYIITTGITLQIALAAREILEHAGYSIGILHFHTVKPFDSDTFIRLAKNVRVILTIEEGIASGGLGGVVAETIVSNFKQFPKVVRIGLPEQFPVSYGSQDNQLHYFGITKENIIKEFKKALI